MKETLEIMMRQAELLEAALKVVDAARSAFGEHGLSNLRQALAEFDALNPINQKIGDVTQGVGGPPPDQL